MRLYLPVPPSQPCSDCEAEAYPYMVHARVWRRAGGIPRTTHRVPRRADLKRLAAGKRMARDPVSAIQFLCLPCLEKRLERRVRRTDFLKRSINAWQRWRGGRLQPCDLALAWLTTTMRT